MVSRKKRRRPGKPAGIKCELTVERLLNGPQGIARYNGRAVFIPRSVPGDRVKVRLKNTKKSFIEAEVLELLEPSPLRRKPPCRLAGRCGGCQWLHVDYDCQLQAKQENVLSCLERIGGIQAGRVEPPVPSPAKYHYRHRARLRCRILKGGRLVQGFVAARSHRMIEHDECWIYVPTIRKALSTAGRFIPVGTEGYFRTTAAHSDSKTALSITVRDERPVEGLAAALREASKRLSLAWTITCTARGKEQTVESDESSQLTYTIALGREQAPLRFAITADVFFQANLAANNLLVSTAIEWAGLSGREHVVDLYCGVGNLTVPLALRAGSTVGVELDARAASLAAKNLLENNAKAEIRRADAAAAISDLVSAGHKIDLLLLDPPREGAKELIPSLLKLAPPKIVYVSCDPATLARDAAALVKGGYHLKRVRVFDLFPQTYHVETLAEFARI